VDPPDFGVMLSFNNIDGWFAATRKAGRDYVRTEPDEARFVYQVVDRLAGSAGSNCGTYMDELRPGSEALRRCDQKAARAAFHRAKAIDEIDRSRAAWLGVSYREPVFASALKTAEAGGELYPNLTSWEAYQKRGIERDAAGDHAGAADDFLHAIRIGPPVALLDANEPQQAASEFEAGPKLETMWTVLSTRYFPRGGGPRTPAVDLA
jgi:hypothetical protein